MKTIRKMSALICAVGIALTQYIPAMAVDSGTGTAQDPYKISTSADFYDIAHNPSGCYILTKDIAVNSLPDVNFSGTLDGNGHLISMAKIEPLFGTVSGNITGLAVYGNVKGGGILAEKLTGSVSESQFTGSVSVSDGMNAGGIAGSIDGGSVKNVIVSASIEGKASNAGALAGEANNAKIEDCFADAAVTSSGDMSGAVIGKAENSEITDVYYNQDKTNLPYGIGIGSDTTTPVEWQNLKKSVSYTGLSLGAAWNIIDDYTTPMLTVINGTGSETQPYKIHSLTDYNTIIVDSKTAGKYYRLENNITNSSYKCGNDTPFEGHFDGNNHWMRQQNGAMFKTIGESGIVENVLCNVGSSGYLTNGAIADVNYGAIRNCFVYADVLGTAKDAGGIAGENIGGTISGCYFKGSVAAYESGMGGIVGYNSYGTIENCGADMRSTGHGRAVGGIAGDNSYGTIKNCYAETYISGGSEIGGIVGRLYNGSVINSYADGHVYGNADLGGIYGAKIKDIYVENVYFSIGIDNRDTFDTEQEIYMRSADDMKKQSTFAGFDFNSTWSIDEGDGMPLLKSISGSGTIDDPYKIRSEEEFSKVKPDRRLYYELENDIPLMTSYTQPKGDFIGSLNGNGHEVNLTSGRPMFSKIGKEAYIGNLQIIGNSLASAAEDAAIEYTTLTSSTLNSADVLIKNADNCTINNCRVFGANNSDSTAGGLINTVKGGSIELCSVINSDINGKSVAGGLVGMASGTIMKNSFVWNTTVESQTAGGFIGRNDNNSKIMNCSSHGTIKGGGYSGAFAGMNYADISSSVGLARPEDGSDIPFAGYDGGTITDGSLTSNSDTYKIILTGGIGTNVHVPTLKTEEKTAVQTVMLSDISGHWAEATITKLVGKGVINGYEDGTYRPQNSVTKGEFLTLLLAATNTKLQDGFTDYEDVNKHWAKKQVYTAIKKNITDNIAESSSSFGVDKAITRAEAVALMGRLIANGESGTLNFTDNADIPDWAKNEVGACVSKGIINGMDDGSFAPNKSLTRAESAIIIDKLMELK